MRTLSPLLAKLCRVQTGLPVERYRYDTGLEVLVAVGSNHEVAFDCVLGTTSQLTRADSDPTSDEASDR